MVTNAKSVYLINTVYFLPSIGALMLAIFKVTKSKSLQRVSKKTALKMIKKWLASLRKLIERKVIESE